MRGFIDWALRQITKPMCVQMGSVTYCVDIHGNVKRIGPSPPPSTEFCRSLAKHRAESAEGDNNG
jgi:hypothetical protein